MSNKDYVNLKVKQKLKLFYYFFKLIFFFTLQWSEPKKQGTAHSLNNNFPPSVVLSFYLIYIKLWHNYFRRVISLLAKLNHCGT